MEIIIKVVLNQTEITFLLTIYELTQQVYEESFSHAQIA